MVRTLSILLMVFTLLLAICLSIWGLETRNTNALGWFLLAQGVFYLAASAIAFSLRPDGQAYHPVAPAALKEGDGGFSFGLLRLVFLVTFLATPVEWQYLPGFVPRLGWMQPTGLGMVIAGLLLAAWTCLPGLRRLYRPARNGIRPVWERPGPYRLIRHPGYASVLLMALGVVIGYSSLIGLLILLFLLLPLLIHRIRVEEARQALQYGEAFLTYRRRTRHLIPAVW